MGALHRGHASLIRTAADECADVGISIFVNPTQFGPHEDFARYPRTLESDLDLAAAAGATWAFVPEVETLYPRLSTKVQVSGITDLWEGAHRPGHFDGVATVVLKLFNIVEPNVAYFGQKDLQQCAVISRMVADLNLKVELRLCPTVREDDGLALSSRNRYLTTEERTLAPYLQSTLRQLGTASFEDEPRQRDALLRARNDLEARGFRVDYLEFIDLDRWDLAEFGSTNTALIVAARLGKTRLIDNFVENNNLFMP